MTQDANLREMGPDNCDETFLAPGPIRAHKSLRFQLPKALFDRDFITIFQCFHRSCATANRSAIIIDESGDG